MRSEYAIMATVTVGRDPQGIDGATNAVATTVTVGTDSGGVAVGAMRNRVYVANTNNDSVAVCASR